MFLILWNSVLSWFEDTHIFTKSRLQLLYLVMALRNCSTSNIKSAKYFPSYKSADSACLLTALCWNRFRLHQLSHTWTIRCVARSDQAQHSDDFAWDKYQKYQHPMQLWGLLFLIWESLEIITCLYRLWMKSWSHQSPNNLSYHRISWLVLTHPLQLPA